MATWTRALVTGGTSGIGAAIAGRLASLGTSLVIVGRDQDALSDRLTELEPLVEVEGIIADLGDSADLARVEQRLLDCRDPVDLLVNCAGYSVTGPVVEQALDVSLRLLEVNVTALVSLSFAAARRMKSDGFGSILNISSIGAYRSTPGSVMYAASKGFVNAFSRGLAMELAGAGVTVTCVCPGPTDTQFLPRAGVDMAGIRRRGALVQDADEVAIVALAAMEAGDVVTLTSRGNSDDVLRSVVSEWQSTVVREPVEPSVEHAMPFPVGTTA
jgi:uncharacterized protein